MYREICLALAAFLALATLVTGWKAGERQRQAGATLPDAKWPLDPTGSVPFWPVDQTLYQMGEIAALNEAIAVSGKFNADGAWWTKVTVALGFAAAMCGIAASI